MKTNNKFYSIFFALIITVLMTSCKTSSMMDYSGRNYDHLLNENSAPARPVVKRDTVYETVIIKQQVVAQPEAQAPAVAPKATTQAPAATVASTSPEVASTTVTTTTTTRDEQAYDNGFVFLWDFDQNVNSVHKGNGSHDHYYSAKHGHNLVRRHSWWGIHAGGGVYYDKETGPTWMTGIEVTNESDFFQLTLGAFTSPRKVNEYKSQSYGLSVEGSVFLIKTKKLTPSKSDINAYRKHNITKIKPNRKKLNTSLDLGVKAEYSSHGYLPSSLVNIEEGSNIELKDNGTKKANNFNLYLTLGSETELWHFASGQTEHTVVLNTKASVGANNAKTNDAWNSKFAASFMVGIGIKF